MQSHGHYLPAFCKQFKKLEKVNVSETTTSLLDVVKSTGTKLFN